MAEERDLATVRAADTTTTGEDVSKEELQRRMEEARESITQTVAEIKDTVTTQYQAVRETVTEALDWREQYRKRPIAFSIGALSIGFCVGYSLAGAFKSDGYDEYEDEEQSSATDASASSYYYRGKGSEDIPIPSVSKRSYAAQAITGAPPAYEESLQPDAATTSYSPSTPAYSGSAETAESEGPGLIERFKGTKAYDRLEEEVSALGDRFINELSKTAQTVVLPALFSKVKELFGVDLSGRESDSGGRASQQRSTAAAASGSSTTGGTGSTGSDQPAAEGSTSYATSENRGYGAAAAGGDYRRGSD